MKPLGDVERIDLLREVEKAEVALASAQIYFERNSEANAALHGSSRVLYSPLVSILQEARDSLVKVRTRVEEDDEDE